MRSNRYGIKIKRDKNPLEKGSFKGCTFDFQQGKIYGLLGRNGAGKTTLFNCLSDELIPDEGRADLIGKKMGKMNFPRMILAILSTRFFQIL